MIIDRNSTLVMTGDSLTDSNRGRPVGTFKTGLGSGYVMLVQAMLGAFAPDWGITVINTGVAGNTIRDIYQRRQTDILDLKPDYVSIMCGVNDVSRQFNIFEAADRFVPYDEFTERYEELVADMLKKTKGMILLGPFFLEANRSDKVRSHVEKYAAGVKDIARKYRLPFVDNQAVLDKYIEKNNVFSLSKDRVHMNTVGHMLLACAFLKAIGAPVSIGGEDS